MDNYENMKKFISKNIMLVITSIVALAYISTSFINIKETGKTLLEILGESLLVFMFSYFIIQSFSLQGILNGEVSKEVIESKKILEDTRKEIGSDVSKLSKWLVEKNNQIESEIKTNYLCDYGLSYESVLAGEHLNKNFTKKELKKIKKIKLKKIIRITASELMNENNKNPFNPMYLGKKQNEFLTQRNISNLISKITFTVLFGYFSTSFIGFNFGDFIWKIIQVVLFLILGTMEYFRSYLYMTGEYCEMLKKKSNILREFLYFIKQ